MRRAMAAVLIAGMAISPAGVPVTAIAQQQSADGTYSLKRTVQRVLTNVVVRDKKTGAVIKGLKQSDFTIVEDKKPQKILTFDYENVDEVAEALTEKEATVSGTSETKKKTIADLVNTTLPRLRLN